ncbi:unnamed protein product, partial [Didymodactylos carnosus]
MYPLPSVLIPSQIVNISHLIRTKSLITNETLPTIPGLSADSNLLILSVQASRLRYGGSATFVMTYPSDVQKVIRDEKLLQQLKLAGKRHSLSASQLDLWCIFEDGSISPAYSYDSKYGNDRASLLDCPLTDYAIHKLWQSQQKSENVLVYLTTPTSKTPLIKGDISVPQLSKLWSSQPLSLTLCTSPLHNKHKYLAQWIEFHRLVGFT